MNEKAFSNQKINLSTAMILMALCILFGTNSVLVKIVLRGFGLFTAAALRFGMTVLIIIIWARLTGRSLKVSKMQVHHLFILAIVFALQMSLFYFGLTLTYASRTALLSNVQPFVVLLLAHYFIPGDRISVPKVTGMILAFGGILYLFLDANVVSKDIRSGDLVILAAVLVWGINAVYIKRIIHTFAPFQIVLYPMVGITLISGSAAFFFDAQMIGNLTPEVVGSLIFQGLVTGAIGFVLWTSLQQKYGTVAVHSFLFLVPISGVFFGGLILNEPITARILVALVLIVAGIVVVNLRLTTLYTFFSRKTFPFHRR